MCEQDDLHGWLKDVKPPVAYYMIRLGSPEQAFRWAFQRGALDSLREAYRQCCPACRPRITAIASHYESAAA